MSRPESPPADASSLDNKTENPTWGERGFSEAQTTDSDSANSDETGESGETGENWNRQQKRVFQRTNTLLRYWEARDYDILWLTFTSCLNSKPADELSYSHQRLRQRVERARRAVCDPSVCPHHEEATAHPLGHIDRLEHLQIRTCEGPQGVLHTFWAWDRQRLRDGNHDRELFIPQNWLADQWADVHGTQIPSEPGELEAWPESAAERVEWLRRQKLDRAPFVVHVSRVGDEHVEGEHAPERMSSYAASQYLGDHGEALEHMSWSHGRSIGGPLAEVWDKLKGFCETVEAAVEVWKRVIDGERVNLTAESSNGINYEIAVEPPPQLAMSQSASVTPPDDYSRSGPHGETRVTSHSDGTGIESCEPMDWERDRDRFGQQSLSGTDVSLRVMNHRQRGFGDWERRG